MESSGGDGAARLVVEPEAGPSWAERAALDPLAAVIDPADAAGAKNALIDAAQRRALRAELDPRGGRLEILDFGCGTGRMTAWLAGLGHDAGGIDAAPEMVAAARAAHPGIRFDAAESAALPRPDASVDVVLSVWVLQYLVLHPERLDAQLAEIRRVLRPGGRLLALEQAQSGGIGRGTSAQAYADRLAAAGLTVESTRPVRRSDSRVVAHVAARPWLGRLPGVDRLALAEARRGGMAIPPGGYVDALFVARRAA